MNTLRPASLVSLPSRRAAATGALFFGACVGAAPPAPVDPVEEPSGTSEAASTDDGASVGTSGDAGTTATSAEGGSDTSPPLADCNEPLPVPPAPLDCTGATGVIVGSVLIEPGHDAPSILENVRQVEGSVRINGISVTNLDFMVCLQEVNGDVTIYDNDELTDVSGLWSLTAIGTDFVFSENDAITIFDGLPNVTVVPRNVVMKNNGGLQSIRGFHQLSEVGDNLIIQQNDALLDVNGLGGLRTVGGVFAITANPNLCISSVDCVGAGITDPAMPPASWSTQANDFGC